nr:electron transfer flavoprotein beta subunit lysine methyltransferase-like [Procambarus clarkii]XP_045597159.1 electron transfer flavoprotein beta subunit lysine methyltransferase-like [Procambarus clarkii]XP_045597160.1 electron transfer flavoprotein beta subunit lysine methyltransferase-like [Procambarus clarkii]XP_045597161.1 electron transfer flavoprotein beta subunit lysine methyltransferase-like [Procambarus clarkii]
MYCHRMIANAPSLPRNGWKMRKYVDSPTHCRFPIHQITDGIKEQNLRDQITAETCLSRNHLTPELQLNLITHLCRLWTCDPKHSPFRDPFWAFYWPGGQAVSRFVLDNSQIIKGKKVLDFGSGCGASGLAAKLCRAKQVTFNDIDEAAIESVLLNGLKNKLTIDDVSTANLVGTKCHHYDVILVGDMLYDAEFANEVLSWLKGIHESGSLVLIGDPGRFALASHPLKTSLRCLGKYELSQSTMLENNGHSQAFVWTFT